MKIELLYIDDCPSRQAAVDMIEEVLKEVGATEMAEVIRTRVSSFAEAEVLKFLGSPTIRVNGVDIDPDASRSTQYEIACRVYRVKGEMNDLPNIVWLRNAVKKAFKEEQEKVGKKGKGRVKYGAKPTPRPGGLIKFEAGKKKKKK